MTFEDAFSDPLTLAETNAEAFRRAKARAAIIVPFTKNGRFVAALYVHARRPRQWTDEQAELVRRVAALTWAAVERARAEDALRESEMRFRLIADAAPFPMWLAQLDGKRTFINKSFVKFLGKPYQEALDFDWRHILHPDDADCIPNDPVRNEASEQPRMYEARYRCASGEWRWLRSVSQARRDGNGVHVGFIGAAYDITTERQATLEVQALREALAARVAEPSQELDRVWAISRDLLVVIGAGRIIRAVNPAWKMILGHDPSEVTGKSLLDFVCPDDFELTTLGIDAAGSKIDVTNFHNRCKHSDGTLRWVSMAHLCRR